MTIKVARKVLYLDIDGTVRQGKEDTLGRFVNGPDDVVVFPEAVVMMRRWKEEGGLVVGVSNQGGIALGIVEQDDVTAAMAETNRQADMLFDLMMWCSHHPKARDPEMARCWCRKPSAGAIAVAANGLRERRSPFIEFYPPHLGLMVGDMNTDRQCAEAACLDYLDAEQWRSRGAALNHDKAKGFPQL